MKKNIISFVKRGIAIGMMAVMAFMLPATPLHESHVQAAEAHSCEYIKELKLFIKKEGSLADAENWCKEQGGGWKVFDKDTNAGAAARLTKEVGVFICYTTTTDPDEAITDLAVMNEKGGYSVSDYEVLLKTQKEHYINIVKNMRVMLDEYRKNYNNKTEMAVLAHDHLNKYREDDSGELMGDLLLSVDDEKLAEILLQCNGAIYLDIEQQLAFSCDTAKTTWLDRMAKLGSFDKLKNAFSKNMASGDVTKALDKQYREKAVKLLDGWDDMSKRIADLKNFEEKYGLKGASQEEFNKWLSEQKPNDEGYLSYQELTLLTALNAYKYGDKTLFEFFSKTKAQIEKEGIEVLYPLAACLTDGQMGALSSGIGLYQLMVDAYAATVINNNNVGLAAEVKKIEEKDAELSKQTEKIISDTKKMITDAGDVKVISVYDGVDREVFKGGVAVTTGAKRASAAKEQAWALENSKINASNMEKEAITWIGTAIGFGIAAGLCAGISRSIYVKQINNLISNKTFIQEIDTSISNASELFAAVKDGSANAKEMLRVVKDNISSDLYQVLDKSQYAFALGFIIFSIYDIVLTIQMIKNYYNVEHIEIPHHMVDIAYSETQEESYITYKTVPDQDGKPGDMNGNNAVQWLGLYYTKDKSAGTPILAPTEGGKEMVLVTGSKKSPGNGYSPLHMFGTVNVAQNLTYADGLLGYSYMDSNNGTYLYFSHANKVVIYTGKEDEESLASDDTEKADEDVATDLQTDQSVEEAQAVSGSAVQSDQAGTAISGGVVALVGVAGLVVGGFGGFVIANTRRKKRIS